MPSEGLWYKNSLETPTSHVSGVSIPGVPFVLMGRNEHISWTFTPSAETSDQLVRLTEEEEHSVLTTTKQEAIKVSSNGTDYFVEVDVHHTQLPSYEQAVPTVGDLVSPRVRAYMSSHRPHTLSMRLVSPALQGSMDLQFLMQLNAARTRQDFVSACASTKTMALTVLYADAMGHIGYAVTSPSPEGVRSAFDPESGYYVSSSGSDASRGRLETLLQTHLTAADKLTSEGAQRVFLDELSPSSLQLVDIIQRIDLTKGKGASLDDDIKDSILVAKNVTAGFDGVYSVNSVAPTVLEAFRSALMVNVATKGYHALAQYLIEGGAKMAEIKRSQPAMP